MSPEEQTRAVVMTHSSPTQFLLMFLKVAFASPGNNARKVPIYHDRRHVTRMLLNSNVFAVERHFRATKRAHVQERGRNPGMLLREAKSSFAA